MWPSQDASYTFSWALTGVVGNTNFPIRVVPQIPTKAAVAARIRVLVDAVANGNQSEFARRCGLNQADVHRYLTATSLPGGEHLAALAIGCSVSVDWLLCLTDLRRPLADDIAGWVDDGEMARLLAESTRSGRFLPYGSVGGRVRLVGTAELARIVAQVDARSRELRGRRRPTR